MYVEPRILICGYAYKDNEAGSEKREVILDKIKPYVKILNVYPESSTLEVSEVDNFLSSGRLEGILFETKDLKLEDFKNKFPQLAIEDESNLAKENIKDLFLTKLFIFAWFNEIKNNLDISDLVKFQAKNKFLLMSYDRNNMKNLGKIVANEEKRTAEEVFKLYQENLNEIFNGHMRSSNVADVLMHMKGYFKDKLTEEEKRLFSDMIESYKHGKIPLKIPKNVLKSWAEKYNNDYLLTQTFFYPYPDELRNNGIIKKD